MEKKYNFKSIESKWQNLWDEKKTFQVKEDSSKKKYYLLEMFPYPSGNIHMGHVRNYAIGDAIARYKQLEGFNVLHPMGWDSFGLPAENAAIKHKSHPAKWTKSNIEYMTKQLKSLGFSYDWKREVTTCNPDYYKWSQWIFLKMLEKGLVYRKKSFNNWCASCNTVLANEQVSADGTCWRCESLVSQKNMNGWFLKITDYAEDLLKGCNTLSSGWKDRVLSMQKNWIGKSHGTEVNFCIVDSEKKIKIFTTRPDTLFGATFICLAPESPLLKDIVKGQSTEKKILSFINAVSRMNKIDRSSDKSEKEGIFTGRYATNPLNGEIIPIWVANFVLIEYGTGAIMCVPAHDQRDFEFAKKYQLKIRQVIRPKDENLISDKLNEAYTGQGIIVNSRQFDNIDNKTGIEKINTFIEKEKIGKKIINYRLRDWGISRQRYWGTPIPIIYCEKCGTVPTPLNDLPVTLPTNIDFPDNGTSPIKDSKDFIETKCPKCNGNATRETDTMDTFICSSWYFARFTSPDCNTMPIDSKKSNYWMPIDQYVGGIEHAVLHLLYARFFTKFLNNIGILQCDEPFKNLLTQGMVIKDGTKMSKSKGNVVNPDDIIEKYGADTVRLFILFASPPERDLDWSIQGVEGAFRFINRVWRLVCNYSDKIKTLKDKKIPETISPALKEVRRNTHKTIKKVSIDIGDRFHFNTAISSIMELVNNLYQFDEKSKNSGIEQVFCEAINSLILLLSPFVPHISEEMWQMVGNSTKISEEKWPKYIPEVDKVQEILIVVQLNGKLRHRINMPPDLSSSEIEKRVMSDSKIKELTKDFEIIKVIVVPKKLVNIVIRKKG